MGVDVYDAAMQDLSLGNYDLAEVGFLSFLSKNPRSELADDARYGLAETFYARKLFEEAAAEYFTRRGYGTAGLESSRRDA